MAVLTWLDGKKSVNSIAVLTGGEKGETWYNDAAGREWDSDSFVFS